jgi:hypothetical protein
MKFIVSRMNPEGRCGGWAGLRGYTFVSVENHAGDDAPKAGM